MKKYKVNINREKISSEEIASRRDFDAVLKNYASGPARMSKPFYKSSGFIAGAAVVVTAAVATWWYTSTHSASKEELSESSSHPKTESFQNTTRQFTDKSLAKSFISRPFKNVDIKYRSYTVNAGKGAELTHSTGSKVKVPAGAFADANGNDVHGNVELRYREFHDPIDFFISGIPMTYDSAGTTYHFESAGMMELLAYQDGKPLKMKQGKEIEVELRSDYEGLKYNLYMLDTNARNWVYEGKDKVKKNTKEGQDQDVFASNSKEKVMNQVIETKPAEELPEVQKLTKEIENIKKDIAKIESTKPDKPRKGNTGRFKFNLDVKADEFPELVAYKDVVFEVGEENKNFTKETYKMEWEDVELSEGPQKGVNYKLTLAKGNDKQTFIVYPVLVGKNYETAMSEYKQKFSTYQSQLAKRKADEADKEKEYQSLLKKIEEERKAEQAKWTAQQQALQQQWQQQAVVANTVSEVYRVFRVDNFGVWNCDSPNAYPRGNTVAANFADAEGKPVDIQVVQLVDHMKNGIFIYYAGGYSRFSYNPASKNMIWAVTPDNKLAIVRNEEFANIPKNGTHTFRMTVADKEFKTPEEIRAYIMGNSSK